MAHHACTSSVACRAVLHRAARVFVLSASAVLALPALAQGQVYKWTDEQGRTHYGERKPDRADAKAAELRLAPLPPVPPPAPAPRRPIATEVRPVFPTPPARASVPAALSDGRDHGTDASRCALARDVLSGAVRHGNGAPTDQNDRTIAANDIQRFCK